MGERREFWPHLTTSSRDRSQKRDRDANKLMNVEANVNANSGQTSDPPGVAATVGPTGAAAESAKAYAGASSGERPERSVKSTTTATALQQHTPISRRRWATTRQTATTAAAARSPPIGIPNVRREWSASGGAQWVEPKTDSGAALFRRAQPLGAEQQTYAAANPASLSQHRKPVILTASPPGPEPSDDTHPSLGAATLRSQLLDRIPQAAIPPTRTQLHSATGNEADAHFGGDRKTPAPALATEEHYLPVGESVLKHPSPVSLSASSPLSSATSGAANSAQVHRKINSPLTRATGTATASATPCAPLPVGMCSAAIPIPTGKSNVSSGISSGTTLSSSGKFQHQMQQRKTSSPSGVSACTSFSPKQQRALHIDTSAQAGCHGSTSSDVVPVLLSPVLSRPVRSLSSCSHQYAFFRQPAISDSEPELSAVLGGAPLAVVPSSHSTAGLMAPSRGRKLRLSTSSRPSADSSGSLQTPPRSISPLALPPGVGGASGLVQPPLPHMSCCVATGLARHSPLSQSMSLLSKHHPSTHHCAGRQQLQQHSGVNGAFAPAIGAVPRSFLQRSDSDAVDHRYRRRADTWGRIARRQSGMHSQTSVDSSCSAAHQPNSTSMVTCGNLLRMRNTLLGHSDPQISMASSCAAGLLTASQLNMGGTGSPNTHATAQAGGIGNVRLRRDLCHQSANSPTSTRAMACRRSLNASTSPILAQRYRSPGRSLLHSAGNTASTSTAPKNAPLGVPMRTYSTRSGSSLVPVPAAPHTDNRRWSVASLPSSSGYGTPGSNSAFSSEYSSQEQLCDLMSDVRLTATSRFDSNENYAGYLDDLLPRGRPRSRSLTSPVKFSSDQSCGVVVQSTIYKERFPKAKQQMEEKLSRFIEENAPLSGTLTSSAVDLPPATTSSSRPQSPGGGAIAKGGGASTQNSSLNMSTSSTVSRRSVLVPGSGQPGIDPALLRLIADGATRFLHHQIVEIASDCLAKSRDNLITCAYFCDMSQRLEETLSEARDKTAPECCSYLSKLVTALLMIVSRPARLLECLEFDPDEFYHMLEEAEGAVREQLGSGDARVPDLPQYIISKLGLDRDPLAEQRQHADLVDLEHSSALVSSFEGALPSGGESQRGAEHKWEPPPESRLPCEEDYETIRLISNGAYGAVYLVRHRETRHRYALKRMNKQTLILRNQVDQVYAERDILTFTDNPFVVSFYGSFETRHHLCMLMEYVEGGDCAALLKNVGTLPIDLARLYIAETVLAIDYLHSCGIVHRDLKPDNLLITAMGHVKLTDFGLSKIGLMNRTTLVSEGCLDVADTQQFKDKQLCGTPEYIAPEVILRQGYGKPVDWWAMGIIIYEFLIGVVPFLGETPEQLFANIISEEAEFPEGDEALPVEAESLIALLLEKNPNERLATVGGAQQVMIQPFFDGLDFRTLLRQKAEFVPQLSNEEDTSYFDTRADRYNHDAESGDDESAPMFGSFTTGSPRHSVVGMELAVGTSPMNISVAASAHSSFNAGMRRGLADSESFTPLQRNSSDSFEGTHSNSIDLNAECPIPTAVLLRRRFSAQRQSNLSTSSSGTTGTGTGTGTGCMNTACSSTDSSMDAGSIFAVGGSVGVTPPAPGWSTNSQGLLISGGATADYGSQSGVAAAAYLGAAAAATTGSSGGSDSHLAGSASGMGALGSTMKRSAGSTSSVGKDGVVGTAGNTSSTAMTSGTSATQLPRFAISSCEPTIGQYVPPATAPTGTAMHHTLKELSPVEESVRCVLGTGEIAPNMPAKMEAAVSSEATCEQAARAGSVEGLGQQLEKMRGAGGAAGTGLEESTAATSSGGGTTSVPTSTPTTTRVALRGGGTAHLSASGTLQLVIPGQQQQQQQQACAVAGGSTQISPASSLGSGSGHGLGSALSSARSCHHHYPTLRQQQQHQQQQSPVGSISSVSSQDGALGFCGASTGGGGISPNPSLTLSAGSADRMPLGDLTVSAGSASGGSATSIPAALGQASSATTAAAGPPSSAGSAGSGGGGGAGAGSSHVVSSTSLKPPILIKRGPKGFGFTIHSMRVYLGEHSDFYTIEHIVGDVDASSPAFDAGLRANDLITHVNSIAVSNLTHPQLMSRLLAHGNELSIKVTPLSATSIREGAARRSVGKLARRKPKRPQRRVPLEKKSRKPSSLLRRLSGKRSTNDIVPGSSSQKQTFMPRSVSSQDGIQSSSASSNVGMVGGGVATVCGTQPGSAVTASAMVVSCASASAGQSTAQAGSSAAQQSSSPSAPCSQIKILADTGLSGEDLCTAAAGSSSSSGTSPLVMPSVASRPSTLQGLKHKVAGMAHHLTARKHSSSKMPVSPLARHENISISPNRSPSPSSQLRHQQRQTTNTTTTSSVEHQTTTDQTTNPSGAHNKHGNHHHHFMK